MQVHFIDTDGNTHSAKANAGENLLEIAQGLGLPLEGTCEGQMACSTCHIIIGKDWFGKLSDASEEEEDMLDLASGVQATSRLACQITITEEMDGLTAHLPHEHRDMSRV